MRVPAHIRFTLAEAASMMTVAKPTLEKVGSAIHLVLTEEQRFLPSPRMEAVCSIISVEDADGITVAVLKHPEGKTWATVTSEQTARSKPNGNLRQVVRIHSGGVTFHDERKPEPVVPRREPPHAAPAGEDRFQRGLKAMDAVLFQSHQGGNLKGYGIQNDSPRPAPDITFVDGQISLRALARAFLDAYQPQITISDQVRVTLAKRAMKLLLRKWRDEGNIEHLAGSPAAPAEEWADNIGDIISIEGTIDIDALAKAAWSVMKEGQGR